MSIYTDILSGGVNNHETVSERANAIATDFVSEGVVGAITNTAGVAPMTGAFAVNAQGTPDMTTAVSAGVAYVTATPSGQASQSLRVYSNASANVTHAANSSGSTKYDWVYIAISAANAANPSTAGDDVATLVVSRSSSATNDDGTPPTYGYPIAVVTVANGASSITNGNIADVRDVTGVTAAKMNFGSGAAGVWWEEIGRTTLTAAGDTISLTTIPARKYLRVMLYAINTGGTINPFMRFNNDSSAAYSYRNSPNGAADGTAISQTTAYVGATPGAYPMQSEIFITNTVANEKIGSFVAVAFGGGGATVIPSRVEGSVKWANTAAQINQIDIINGGDGDFAIGSELVVLGHN